MSAKRTRAFSGPIGDSGVRSVLTTGSPFTEAGRWSTTSLFDPAFTSGRVVTPLAD